MTDAAWVALIVSLTTLAGSLTAYVHLRMEQIRCGDQSRAAQADVQKLTRQLETMERKLIAAQQELSSLRAENLELRRLLGDDRTWPPPEDI